jgi:hypothetical protein
VGARTAPEKIRPSSFYTIILFLQRRPLIAEEVGNGRQISVDSRYEHIKFVRTYSEKQRAPPRASNVVGATDWDVKHPTPSEAKGKRRGESQ